MLLHLTVHAPPDKIQPVVAFALLQGAGTWRLDVPSPSSWQWTEAGGATLRLTQGATSGSSLLRLEASAAFTRLSEKVIEQIVQTLRAHHFDVAPARSGAPAPRARAALFVAPHRPPFTTLAPLIERATRQFGVQFHFPMVDALAPGELRRLAGEVGLVIAAWETLPGRTALYQGWAQEQPVLALVREADAAADWPGPLLVYGESRADFLTALNDHLAAHFERRRPDPPSDRQNPTLLASTLSPAYVVARRRIYQGVALDRRAPPQQRFHAARVLAESGDTEGAAKALGALAIAHGHDLADEALNLLGGLGEAAQPILWRLDAYTANPQRAIAIARQLLRAGDAQTALFRLEWLAQHEQEPVRLAALDALAEAGPLAAPRVAALAQQAGDPAVRLRAAQWLHAQGASPDLLRHTLVALASQSERPDLAHAAVELLAKSTGEATETALLSLARHASSVAARLGAAEALHQRGEVAAARGVLLELAQGSDNLAAGAAMEMLVSVSDRATADTQAVMNAAALKSVRRRAALLLVQPHQPEEVQQAAARVLLDLDRQDLARPVLARLARSSDPTQVENQRWAAQQLALLGGAALDEIRAAFVHADDPVVGQYLAEGLLAASHLPEDRRQAANWLAEHSNLPRAVEVLGDLALSARVSGSEAVRATNDLSRYAARWAGAARALATLVSDSPHPAVRARALDLLLREFPSELPLALLVDLAVTGSIGAADRSPVMEQLAVLARPAASRIAARLTDEQTDTERRWQLLQLMNELPDSAATPALLQLSARAPQNRIRYVASEQLIARGQQRAGYAALATIAINETDPRLREMALYELAQGLPETEALFGAIIERTRYEETGQLARELLRHPHALLARTSQQVDQLLALWRAWVASLPLGWFDRLVGRLRAPGD